MTAYTVNVQIEARYAEKVKAPGLRAAARAALKHQAAPAPAEITIIVSGDALLRRLNRQYLGHDEPTDVLSFPNSQFAIPNSTYLGDIALSLPRARSQASAAGHSLAAELRLLVVHGVLHLLGHDHAGRAGKARMWAAQTEILHSIQTSTPPRKTRKQGK